MWQKVSVLSVVSDARRAFVAGNLLECRRGESFAMVVLNDRRRSARPSTRRQAPRWLVNRNAQIYLKAAATETAPRMLFGYTHDMSARGLSLTLPALDCSVQDLFDLKEPLEIVIAVTPEVIKVKATPVHCETTSNELPIESACIGVEITEHDNGYQRYLDYLKEFQAG